MILFNNLAMIKDFFEICSSGGHLFVMKGKLIKNMWKIKQYIRKHRRLSMLTLQNYTVYSNVMLRFAMQALLQDQPLRSCILYF